jgi:hypothetical protein
MLILVGVTVTVAINGELFEKAKEAAKGTEIEREKEELTSAITTAYDEATGKVYKEKLKEALGTGWSVDGEEGGPYTVKSPKQNTYKVAVDGTITEKKTIPAGTKLAEIYCDDENCTEETHLHKGDYVNYTPKTEKTAYAPDKGEGKGKYTGSTSGSQEQSISQENLKWRVLGKDDKGNILLISGAPTTAGLSFSGYVGYNNFEDVLNDTCEALYSNTDLGATASSLTMDDIDTYLGGNSFPKENYGGGSSRKGGYGYHNAKEITSKFTYNKDTNTLTKADTTIAAKRLTSNEYYYSIENTITDSKNKEILQGTNSAEPYYYWVASRSVGVNSDVAHWCLDYVYYGSVNAREGVCYSGGFECGNSICLRPVVSLPSNVTVGDVPKKAGTVIESWNNPLGKDYYW